MPATNLGKIVLLVICVCVAVQSVSAQVFTVLHTFTDREDGGQPLDHLILDSAGNLYGTTYSGGAFGRGNIFKLGASGQLTVLYSFTGGLDGGQPVGNVILDRKGNLYGTTFHGGAADAGVVFKLDPSGNETVLHSFAGNPDGANPTAGLVRDGRGNLYGITQHGGASNLGAVFKVDRKGTETILHSFRGRPDGFSPYAALIRDAAGNLYGTTGGGGTFNKGTVFKVDTNGTKPCSTILKGAMTAKVPMAE